MMANQALKKVIATNISAVDPFEYEIPKSFRFSNFTVEAVFDPLDAPTYPNAENDASLELLDGEQPSSLEGGTSPVNYEVVDGGFVLVAEGTSRIKIRIVDLATRNSKVRWVPNSANGGTIQTLSITFQA